jgi:predicted amidohydrolase
MKTQSLPVYDPVIQTFIKDNRFGDPGEKEPLPKERLLKDPVVNDPLHNPPRQGSGIRYAIAQGPSQVVTINSIAAAIAFNMKTMQTACRLAQHHSTQLISFPELFLSGYDFGHSGGKELAYNTAHWLKDKGYLDSHLSPVAAMAKKYNVTIICPMPYVGQDPKGNEGIYDVAVVFGHCGTRLGISFKLHLWGTEERDWFNVPCFPEIVDQSNNCQNVSNPFRTYVINGFTIGISLCYDAEFPEVARCLSLNGALLNVIPTAAPEMINANGTCYPDVSRHYIQANALTNQNFCSYGNRAQYEYRQSDSGFITGYLYSGNSIICDPYGQVLLKPVTNQDALLIADCVIDHYPPAQPAETNYLINRRPELYHVLTAVKNAPFRRDRRYNNLNE